MDQHPESNNQKLIDNPADIELNKPSKSRFLFLLFFFGFFVFCWAGCYSLDRNGGYQDNSDIEVPKNLNYDPKYN